MDLNTVDNNGGAGIKASGNSGNILRENHAVLNRTAGIDLQNETADTITENAAKNNPAGILAESGATGNKIKQNAAQNNTTFDLEDRRLAPCQNGWADNHFVTNNEQGIE